MTVQSNVNNSFTFNFPFDYDFNIEEWEVLRDNQKSLYKCNHALIMLLLKESAPDLFQKLVITSAWRGKKNNASCGGAYNSRHLTAQAVDLRINDASTELFKRELEFLEVLKSSNCFHVQLKKKFYIS